MCVSAVSGCHAGRVYVKRGLMYCLCTKAINIFFGLAECCVGECSEDIVADFRLFSSI